MVGLEFETVTPPLIKPYLKELLNVGREKIHIMADEVSRALMLDKFLIDGKAVLISQHTGSSPFIHTFLANSVKQGRKVCLVTLHQSATYYHNIGTRLGWNSQLLQTKGQYKVIEGLISISNGLTLPSDETLFDFLFKNESSPLTKLFNRIKEVVTEWAEFPVTLIIDRLDWLLSLGISAQDVVKFYQQCHSLLKDCLSKPGAFITSIELSSSDQVLVHCSNLLSHWCDLVLTVKGLETGVSKDLTGCVQVHWTGNQQHEAVFHFKSFDRGVRMFSPGLAIL